MSMSKLASNRGFWLTLLLSIVTFGIYGYYLIVFVGYIPRPLGR